MNTVKLYDFETKQLTEIPAAELAPGYVRVRIDGIEGEYFVSTEQAKFSQTFRHPPFADQDKALCEVLSAVFCEVFPKTPEEWETGFRRDLNAVGEMNIWKGIAGAFTRLTQNQNLTTAQKKDYFNVILSACNNGLENALYCFEPTSISRKKAKGIVKALERESRF